MKDRTVAYEDVDLETYARKTKQDGFDNEGKEPKFWQYEFEWQRTQLRSIYLEEMRKICPEWVEMYRESEALRDFYNVCMLAENIWEAELVREWIDGLEAGERRSFAKVRFEREPIHISELIGDIAEQEENAGDGECESHEETPGMLPKLKGAVDGWDVVVVKFAEATTQHSTQLLDLRSGIWQYLTQRLKNATNKLLQWIGLRRLVGAAREG